MQSSLGGECSKEEELSKGIHRELWDDSSVSIVSSRRENKFTNISVLTIECKPNKNSIQIYQERKIKIIFWS